MTRITGKTDIQYQKFKQLGEGTLQEVQLEPGNIKRDLPKIKEVLGDKKLALVFDENKYYFLTDRTMNNLMSGEIDENALVSYGDGVHIGVKESDAEWVSFANVSQNVKLIEIKSRVRHNTKSKPAGAFFKYLNKTHFDFSRYGVFKSHERNYNDNCFVLALKAGGMSEEKLNSIRADCRDRIIPRIQIKNSICPKYNIVVSVKTMRKDCDNTYRKYYHPDTTISENTKPDLLEAEYYDIGLVDEHYFLIEKTNVTSFALENYDLVLFEKDCHKIVDKTFQKKNDRFKDSFDVIKILLENKNTLLEDMPYDSTILKSPYYDKITNFANLNYGDYNIKYERYKPKEESKFYVKYHKVFFDFETITVGTHKPYLVCWDDENNEVGTYYNEKTMLNNLPDHDNIMLIAHNANYDVRFLLHLLYAPKPLIKDNRFIAIDALYFKYGNPNKKINLRIKDSYKLIEMALGKFSKAFNLQDNKAVMPYNLYTDSNVKTCFIPIKTAKFFVKNDEEKELENNIDKWDLRRDDNTYDIIEYSKIYCQLDCSVLKKGYEAFREIMFKVTGLDVDNYCTIQGLALDYVLKEGCFDGVVMISGVPQQFISNCVVGGRCMTKSNQMYHVVGKLADFDGVSLYPSSLYRIEGFLKGTPKVLKILTKAFLESVDGYFIRIEILSVGKHRQFPLLSKINEYGVRIFSNDMVGAIVFIDRVGLEDAIKYQDIKFRVIDGYYFDEGRNNKINKVIKHLFDERKKMKEDKNPAEKTVKLLMNSIYGKTILKPIDTDTKVIPEWRKDDYLFRNYNFIKECIKVGNNYYVKLIKSINNHFNYVHCGVEVLSTSKRIMNEVMCLAEDKELSIFYQDTDSIHIIYDEVETLRKAFKTEYDRELVGDNLGQFHIDFDLDGSKKGAEIFSIESYFLGKKDYYDRLQSIDDDDEVIYGDHIRCKGIPTPCVLQKAKELKVKPIDIYKKKYNGETIKFNLTERVDGKPKFKMEKDYSVSTMRGADKGVTRKSEIRDADSKRIKTIFV